MQSPVGRSLRWSAGTDLASKCAVLVTSLIAVRSLQPSWFGVFVGMSATTLMAGALWDFGLSALLTREVAAGQVGARQALAGIARLRSALLPLWLAAFVVGALVIDRDRTVPLSVIAGFAVASLAYGCHSALLAVLRGRLRFRSPGLATASGRWFTAALCLIGVGIIKPHAPLPIFAWSLCLGEVLTLLLAARALLSELNDPWDQIGEQGHLTLRAAMPFCANGVLAMAYNRFDVVILAALASVQQVGFYAPASRIQDALYLIPSSIGLIAFPFVAGAYPEQGGPERVRRITRRLIALGLAVSTPMTVVVFLCAPLLLGLVLGPQYGGAITPTRILIWFLPFAVVQAPLLSALAGSGHAGDTTKVFAVTMATALALHILLDGSLGATGAAIASLSRDPVAVVVAVLLAMRAGILGSPPQVFRGLHQKVAGLRGLDAIIAPEIKDDDFFRTIEQLSAAADIQTVVEIGSSSGNGSTEALVQGLQRNPNGPTLFCIEISRARFARLRARYAGQPFVKGYNVSSVPVEAFVSPEEVAAAYSRLSALRNQASLREVLKWLEWNKGYLRRSGVRPDGLRFIKRQHDITTFDMVLIDGSEFTGRAELDETYGAKLILLDDIRTLKNEFNYERLRADPRYTLVKENLDLRNGYAVFQARSSVSRERSSSRR
jgi:O-antigen/teichoic acid export membrane protein